MAIVYAMLFVYAVGLHKRSGYRCAKVAGVDTSAIANGKKREVNPKNHYKAMGKELGKVPISGYWWSPGSA